MKRPARILFLLLALAAGAGCARLPPDSSLPALYDPHRPEGNAAIWGAGD